MKIYYESIDSIDFVASNSNVLFDIPAGSTIIDVYDNRDIFYIIYSMEDEPMSDNPEITVDLGSIEQHSDTNIWKQQQELKQPDDEKDELSKASRKLNQELLKQYKQKVAELEDILK